MTLAAKAADGATIRYQLHGPDTAPDKLVLIHSLAMTGSFWQPVVDALGDRFQIITLDCRGHGASDKSAGPYSIEQFADDVATVVEHAGWQKTFVAGASMGGCVAIAFAGRHPDRLRGLGLIDTTAWYGETAPADWAGRAEKARAEGLEALVGFQQTRWFGDDFRAANPSIVEESVQVFLQNDIDAYVATCHMLGACDQRHVLPTLAVPAEVVVGSEDYATPVAMAEAMHAQIPDSALQVLDGKRHLTPLEVPQDIAAALTRLAERG